jgi:hypothetical protein
MAKCSIAGCIKQAHARGWCGTHYHRWFVHGDPLKKRPCLTEGPCLIQGCTRPVKARGWCQTHYARWKHHCDPNIIKRAPNGTWNAYFQQALDHQDGSCFIWPHSGLSARNYGSYKRQAHAYPKITHKGRRVSVVILICKMVNGPRPSKKHEVAHSCGNGHLGCVSPRHLRWATHSENETEKWAIMRAQGHPRVSTNPANIRRRLKRST